MLPSISIGPLLLLTPGLVLLLGVWIGTLLAEKESERLHIKKDLVSNLIFYSLISGLIGARLAYAVRTPNVYLEAPLSLFALDINTFAPVEGLVIGLFISLIISQRQGLSLRSTLDALTPGLAVFLIAWALSNVLSGESFGSPSDLPWTIHLWGENRHPVQFYDLFLALVALVFIRQRPLDKWGTGLNFLLLLGLTSFSRLLTEAFRGDSVIWFGSFRAAQISSLLILLGSIWLIGHWAGQAKPDRT